MLTLSLALCGFSAPVAHRASPVARAEPVMSDLKSMPGAYALGGTFDPLGFAEKGDLVWLREAELKHGRLAMLAVPGFIATDLGVRFPAPQFQGFDAVAAHDACVQNGSMGFLALVVVLIEVLHSVLLFPAMQKGWAGHVPGDFQLDPFNMASEQMTTKELKNGRLAMLAFSGLITQAVLHPGFPYY